MKEDWSKRKTQLEHEYAVMGWVLLVLPEILSCGKRVDSGAFTDD